ncbi:MAG TPA: DUF4149 domain-containing protein [Gemmatimonadaceae bacterium]|nr:DUF4149 domain-containing protein [Gemmatimonadaceae bacterium]
MRAVTTSIIAIALLALWLGAGTIVSAVVAPALFAVLPSRTLAGAVVGRVLPAVFYSGIVIGLVALGLEWRVHREWRWAESAMGIMVLACAAAQVFVAPRIEAVRQAIGGPVDALSADDPRRIAFGRLHGESVAWLGLAMVAAAVAGVAIARVMTKE